MGTTTKWYRLATATPRNKTAARVVTQSRSAPKVPVTPSRYPTELPKVIPVPAHMDNFTGKKVGQLTVLGLRKKKSPARMSLWAVQCDCGKVENRQHRSIKKPRCAIDFCCWECLEPSSRG